MIVKSLLLLLSLLLATNAWGAQMVKGKVLYCVEQENTGFQYDLNSGTWKQTFFEPKKFTAQFEQAKEKDGWGERTTYLSVKEDGISFDYSCKQRSNRNLDPEAYQCVSSYNTITINKDNGRFIRSSQRGDVEGGFRKGYGYDSLVLGHGRCERF